MAEINTGINTNVGSHDQHNIDNRRSWTHTDFHMFEFHKGTTNTFLVLIGIIILIVVGYCACRRHHQKQKKKLQQAPRVHFHGGIDPQAYVEVGLPPPPQGHYRPNHIYDRPADGIEETATTSGRGRENFSSYRSAK